MLQLPENGRQLFAWHSSGWPCLQGSGDDAVGAGRRIPGVEASKEVVGRGEELSAGEACDVSYQHMPHKSTWSHCCSHHHQNQNL